MFNTYLALTLLAAAANIFSATLDFIRFKQILVNMASGAGFGTSHGSQLCERRLFGGDEFLVVEALYLRNGGFKNVLFIHGKAEEVEYADAPNSRIVQRSCGLHADRRAASRAVRGKTS